MKHIENADFKGYPEEEQRQTGWRRAAIVKQQEKRNMFKEMLMKVIFKGYLSS